MFSVWEGQKPMNTREYDDDVCDSFEPSSTDKLEHLRDKLPEVEGLSRIFRVLGDETRTKLIYLLSGRVVRL